MPQSEGACGGRRVAARVQFLHDQLEIAGPGRGQVRSLGRGRAGEMRLRRCLPNPGSRLGR